MEALFSFCVGLLVACGVFMVLRGRTFPVVLGITLLSYAVNLFLFSSGRLTTRASAVLEATPTLADPLPQALVLTAIVIGFAMTAFVLVLAIRAYVDQKTDQVDGVHSAEDQAS